MAEAVILNPNQPPEIEIPNVVPEALKPKYKQLTNLIRGNQRLERDLMRRGQMMDPNIIALSRIDYAITEIIGDTETSERRMDFEIKYGEFLRGIIQQAVIAAPPLPGEVPPPQ